VILSCLAKDPEDRPADARELIQRLRAIEIPAEHAWTDDKATSWWKSYRPSKVATLQPDSATSVAPRTIMPARLDDSRGAPTPASASAMLATSAARPALRNAAPRVPSFGPPTVPADAGALPSLARPSGHPAIPGAGSPTMPVDAGSIPSLAPPASGSKSDD
jgi:hypothetical protein